MAIQTINLGNYANDGTGDDLRTAFEKVNANFTLLGGTVTIADGANLGAGAGVFAQRNNATAKLEFKSLTSLDSSVEITTTATTVDLKSKPDLSTDPSPKLGANLDLNGFNIINVSGTGDVQTTVDGVRVGPLGALVELLMMANQLTVDMGTILSPSGFSGELGNSGILLDMGFIDTPMPYNTLDFGGFPT